MLMIQELQTQTEFNYIKQSHLLWLWTVYWSAYLTEPV